MTAAIVGAGVALAAFIGIAGYITYKGMQFQNNQVGGMGGIAGVGSAADEQAAALRSFIGGPVGGGNISSEENITNQIRTSELDSLVNELRGSLSVSPPSYGGGGGGGALNENTLALRDLYHRNMEFLRTAARIFWTCKSHEVDDRYRYHEPDICGRTINQELGPGRANRYN